MSLAYRYSLARDPLAREDITTRRLAGESLETIGESHGLTRERVRQLCKSWGITSPVDLRSTPPAVLEAAAAAVQAGASQAAAAREAGISTSTLRRYIQQQGLELPAAPDTGERWAGRTFGMWTVLPNSYQYDAARPCSRSVECRCECGTVRRVQITNLRAGVSRGCGCRVKNGSRVRTPWVCEATGDRAETTAALARMAGVNYLSVVRKANRGEVFTDSQGREWLPERAGAVPHNAGVPWICIQTRDTWPNLRSVAAHLGSAPSALVKAVAKGRAYAAADGHHYCPAVKEGQLEMRPRHRNADAAYTPQPWICDQTGQQWPSRGQMEKHLGLGSHGLARRDAFTATDGLTYRRVVAAGQQGVAA